MQVFDRTQLKQAIRPHIQSIYKAQVREVDLYKNTLDCFSAAVDSVVQGISLDRWIVQERERQIQKTKQNAIGALHEAIMSSISGVERLKIGGGGLVDIRCCEKKILAEVKNKHNTTKGNHKKVIYDDLSTALEKHAGYTGYYVEILPKNGKTYNTPFIPPDNNASSKRSKRNDVRRIDGKSFYALLTGNDHALEELYHHLPILVTEILQEDFNITVSANSVTDSAKFQEIFDKVYA